MTDIDITRGYAVELMAELRGKIAKHEIELHEHIKRLEERRTEARVQEDYDRLTEAMERAWREGGRAIEPVRQELARVIQAVMAIDALKPITLLIPSEPEATP